MAKLKNTHLANRSYNIDTVIQAIVEVGLKAGDTAYFSTGLGLIGMPEGVQNQDQLNELFFNAIKKSYWSRRNNSYSGLFLFDRKKHSPKPGCL